VLRFNPDASKHHWGKRKLKRGEWYASQPKHGRHSQRDNEPAQGNGHSNGYTIIHLFRIMERLRLSNDSNGVDAIYSWHRCSTATSRTAGCLPRQLSAPAWLRWIVWISNSAPSLKAGPSVGRFLDLCQSNCLKGSTQLIALAGVERFSRSRIVEYFLCGPVVHRLPSVSKPPRPATR